MPRVAHDDVVEPWKEYEARLHDEFRRNGYRKCCTFSDSTDVGEAEVAVFDLVLETASDEKPLQDYLEGYPSLLVGECHGGCRWVIPRPRLGGVETYIPDFLIARINSDGPSWSFVELETPDIGSLHTKDGRRRDKFDHAVNQINDWRRWLTRNLDKAHLSRSAGGLGLVDLYPTTARGIIVIGRADQRTDRDRELLRDLEAQNRIEVWSYDRLIREANHRVEARQRHGPSS